MSHAPTPALGAPRRNVNTRALDINPSSNASSITPSASSSTGPNIRFVSPLLKPLLLPCVPPLLVPPPLLPLRKPFSTASSMAARPVSADGNTSSNDLGTASRTRRINPCFLAFACVSKYLNRMTELFASASPPPRASASTCKTSSASPRNANTPNRTSSPASASTHPIIIVRINSQYSSLASFKSTMMTTARPSERRGLDRRRRSASARLRQSSGATSSIPASCAPGAGTGVDITSRAISNEYVADRTSGKRWSSANGTSRYRPPRVAHASQDVLASHVAHTNPRASMTHAEEMYPKHAWHLAMCSADLTRTNPSSASALASASASSVPSNGRTTTPSGASIARATSGDFGSARDVQRTMRGASVSMGMALNKIQREV
mmetsp:Transcript_7960/g.29433  ORF Transcript_7960/g.29433 Transcript_7960/m.29433 type:complete len:379 (-) Transcript_7960:1670-2806(-)